MSLCPQAVIEAMYPCLGITCDEVGGMLSAEGNPIPGMEPCVIPGAAPESCDDQDSTVVALAIVCGVLGASLVAVSACLLLTRKTPAVPKTKQREVDIGFS